MYIIAHFEPEKLMVHEIRIKQQVAQIRLAAL
jgi:hypothetical protein